MSTPCSIRCASIRAFRNWSSAWDWPPTNHQSGPQHTKKLEWSAARQSVHLDKDTTLRNCHSDGALRARVHLGPMTKRSAENGNVRASSPKESAPPKAGSNQTVCSVFKNHRVTRPITQPQALTP